MVTVRDLRPEDAAALTDLYGEYDWWADRRVEDVRTALRETPVAVGVVDERDAGDDDGDRPRVAIGDGETPGDRRGDDDPTRGRLVAAARVLTDRRYYAVVFDVVAADRRGEGLGERLMRAVVDHPALAATPGLSLLCRAGLVEFYESVGFERFDPEVEVPEGGTERLVRMTYEHPG